MHLKDIIMAEFVVDLDKADKFLQHKWFLNSEGVPTTKINGKYAVAGRIVFDDVQEDELIEFINGNKLDVRRCNLRVLTKETAKERKTEYRGVRRLRTRAGDRYLVYICIANTYNQVGSYETLEEAVAAHDKMIREIMGMNAPVLNIVDFSRLYRVPLLTKHEVDENYREMKKEEKHKLDREKKAKRAGGADPGGYAVMVVDTAVWEQTMGRRPGEEQEWVIPLETPGEITPEEVERLRSLHTDYNSEMYKSEIAAWWNEFGSRWQLLN
jgi:hypothetical protein